MTGVPMAMLKRAASKLNRRAYGLLKTRKELALLSRADHPGARSLATAISATLENRLDDEEQGWIDRIESLRGRLLEDNTVVPITDFGAGPADANRTDEQMRAGRIAEKTVRQICSRASKNRLWSLLLFKLIRETVPTRCVELGTCLGISGAYQAAALKTNGSGRLVTLEGSQELAGLAHDHLRQLDLDNAAVVTGRFQDTLSGVLKGLERVDYAYIDGHHDHDATLSYFKQISAVASDGALFVFDDIAWSDGMARAWKTICEAPQVAASVDLFEVGLCILSAQPPARHQHFKLAIA